MLRRVSSLLPHCRSPCPNKIVTQIVERKIPPASCRVTFWNVRKGDLVDAGGFLCLYERDEGTFWMGAEVSGKVVKIHRREGVDFSTTDPIIDIRPSLN